MNRSIVSHSAVALLFSLGLAACASNSPLPSQPVPNPCSVIDEESGKALPNVEIMSPRDVPCANVANFRQTNMLYNGGTVQTTPSVYVVYWQFTADPHGEAARFTDFLKAAGGSQWLSTVKQYTQYGSQHIASPPRQLKGAWYDNADPVPAHPTDAQIQAEAVRLADHFRAYDPNAAYIVATPAGHWSTGGFKRNWCAYHGNTSARGVALSYTNLPYMSDAGYACGAYAVNSGAQGILDGVTIVGGHELAETQTDPTGGGWYDAGGNEIADKCAWEDMHNEPMGGTVFPTQPLWSNAARNCVQ